MSEERRRRRYYDPFWDPFGDFDKIFDLQERMLGSIPRMEFSTRSSMPYVETHHTDDAFIYEFALPGVKKQDIDLNVDEDGVHLNVKSGGKEKVEKEGYKSVSSRYFGFQGTYPVPENADIKKVKASFNNGVLEVTIPKKVKKPRKKGTKVKIN